VAAKSLGFTSISRVSAGKYLITLHKQIPAPAAWYSAPLSPRAERLRRTLVVDTDAIASAGTITILTQAGGVSTDPASGEILHLDVVVKNSTIAVG
jgi:hypothetical protein